MKHRYFADRRDFLKYELLLDLASRDPSGGRLLSLLMLTPDDGTPDGSIKTYEQGLRRRELYEFLRGCLVAGTRDVSLLREFMREAGVDYRRHRDDQFFDDAGRATYFAGCALAARGHSLMFFDPDIGLETGTRSYMRREGMEKYLMYADVAVVARAAPPDSVLVVYQHLQRDKNRVGADIDEKCQRLCRAIGSACAAYVTDRDVAFLVTSCDAESSRWAINAVIAHGGKHNLETGKVVADE